MIQNIARLRDKAHKMAIDQTSSNKPFKIKEFWKQFDSEVQSIRSFVEYLQENPVGCGQLAENWMLDNAEFVEEQVFEIKENLKDGFLKNLPYVEPDSSLRIFVLAQDYLHTCEGIFDENSLFEYFNSFQEISALNIAEIRSLPLVLKVSLIHKLSNTMKEVRSRKEICMEVEAFLAKLNKENFTTESLNKELESVGQTQNLSGPWIVHLISHLREFADDSNMVREWLKYRFENSGDLNKIITYEHQVQANYQKVTGNIITSLRKIERRPWDEVFKKLNIIDRTFRTEKTEIYPKLDNESRNQLLNHVEKIAKSLQVPENLIAKEAVELSNFEIEKEMIRNTPKERFSRETFIAYYLLESDGKKRLIEKLKSSSEPRENKFKSLFQASSDGYFNNLIGFFSLFIFVFFVWSRGGRNFDFIHWIGLFFTSAVLASEWAVTFLHACIEWFVKPRPLLRLDFARSIPEEATTLVAIPVIWSSIEEVQEMIDRLELHYLSCRESNVLFALLSDYTDSKTEVTENDSKILNFANEKIGHLNQKYKRENSPYFYVLQRNRKWNPQENVFMGWERKRGKLVEFVELLNGRKDTSYITENLQSNCFEKIRYVLTLDADTELPMGNAKRMIATMHLPYNRPRLDEHGTRVVEGYGMLQPRVGVSLESSLKSRLATLWTEAGVDPYAFAATDPYQDAVGHGIFTGKGIFDVQAFYQVLVNRIPDNQILSHDLLEGSLLRTGFLSDIEVVDDHPNKFSSYQKRLHRWTRGDWQLISWLLPRNKDRSGNLKKVNLPGICRWQMIDNLRRSLLPLCYYIILIMGLVLYRGSTGVWLGLLFGTIFLPVIKYLICNVKHGVQTKGFNSTFSYVLINFWILPFQTAVLMHAIGISLYRQFISKKKLLEWTSSSHIERLNHRSTQPTLEGMAGGYALILLFGLFILQYGNMNFLPFGLIIAGMWAIAPIGMRYFDQPIELEELTVSKENQKALYQLAREIWDFYEEYANASSHFLPPDNVQIKPFKGAAPRTSPTNIGYLLTSIFVAKEMGFIDTQSCLNKIQLSISTIEKLEKWHGHLYNWYDTDSLTPLHPRYVSTVDSGNFIASLIALKQGLEVLLEKESGDDVHNLLIDLINRTETLIIETDFRELYDASSKLFVLGYNGVADRKDDILYDLLASEARQTSFVAIALGQIPVSHWFVLGRSTKKLGMHKSLLSWSGTMFEYLMPWQLMKTFQATVWESTYKGVVSKQIQYAHERNLPFGISESGFFAYDHQMNYQYQAFGVPDTGFKRGNDEEMVLAPYATIMALPFALSEGLEDLNRMTALGARGKYGFYEAIDFTKKRLPEGTEYEIVRSFMAHHQGMSLLTIANLLLPTKMYDYFHRDKRVQSAELLLKERIPNKVSVLHKEVTVDKKHKPKPITAVNHIRRFVPTRTPLELNIHSNGKFTSVVNTQGGGFIQYDGKSITRWRENHLNDQWGSFLYIRDIKDDSLQSPTYLPCKNQTKKASAQFSLNHSVFVQSTESLHTCMEICVSPDTNAEFRKLKITNTSNESREIELTSYVELVLAPQKTDESHPTFSKLFIETESVRSEGCLLARKRPRHQNEETFWVYNKLFSEGFADENLEFETDRNAFIERGNGHQNPAQIRSKLNGSTGAVTDPSFIMRNRIVLAPGESKNVYQITGVADSREIAIENVQHHGQSSMVEAAFKQAWTYGQIEMRHFRLKAEDVAVFNQLLSRIYYSADFSETRKKAIEENQKGQSALWSIGISGDNPIVLIRIADMLSNDFAKKCISCHEYLRKNGLPLSFVFLNESTENYYQELQTSLRRLIEQNLLHGFSTNGKIHVINANHLEEESKNLLFALSRIILVADGPSLKAQLKIPNQSLRIPEVLDVKKDHKQFVNNENKMASDQNQLTFFNGKGGFSENGKEYHILLNKENQLPLPWINVLVNRRFGTITSERFTGYTWWRNSRECKLTPWSNDPTIDAAGEACYIRDEKSGSYIKLGSSVSPTFVRYGQGYSVYQQTYNDLQMNMTVFVPVEDPIKLIRCKIQNKSNENRECSLTYFVNWVIGVGPAGNQSMIVTEWDEETQSMIARNHYLEKFREAHAFLSIKGGKSQSWTGNRLEFYGVNGDAENPDSLKNVALSKVTGVFKDSCGTIQSKVDLNPGEEKEILIMLGCDESYEAVSHLVQKYSKESIFDEEFEKLQTFFDETLKQIQIETPSQEMNFMLNYWLLYQTIGCRMWARTAFYQAGGAYGFRDQLQDSLALLHVRPDLTYHQILLHASHQYIEGDVQHWWHQETEVGIRTRFSDDLLWLPYAALRYMEHTGENDILDETAPFLQSEPLEPDNHERYEATVLSGEVGSIYEHCVRALDRSLLVGEHGLPLMGIGDWNDGMSRIGAEGRGESVWLGWFLGGILENFAKVCSMRNDTERAERYREHVQKLKKALNEHAWDGAWYRRAYHDGGVWIGTHENKECRIDSIAQSWSVISGLGDTEKQQIAMGSFDTELVDREIGIAKILTPGFDRSDPSPGYIQGYPPGIRENGGQYTHGVVWGILAWAKLGQGEKAFELFNIMNPVNHSKTPEEVLKYRGEPYVMAADVYSSEPHMAQAGWTWYTGASGWMYQAGIEWILGIKKRGNRLYINPCIPADWPEYKVTYRFGESLYKIQVNNISKSQRGVKKLILDNQEVDITQVESDTLGVSIALQSDDKIKEHIIQVEM
ncbi:MAG: ndvB [Bacillales bacterium]|jgi:cellobiose phosphorylase|nr:ndvB [Bacillales bacterium]